MFLESEATNDCSRRQNQPNRFSPLLASGD